MRIDLGNSESLEGGNKNARGWIETESEVDDASRPCMEKSGAKRIDCQRQVFRIRRNTDREGGRSSPSSTSLLYSRSIGDATTNQSPARASHPTSSCPPPTMCKPFAITYQNNRLSYHHHTQFSLSTRFNLAQLFNISLFHCNYYTCYTPYFSFMNWIILWMKMGLKREKWIKM